MASCSDPGKGSPEPLASPQPAICEAMGFAGFIAQFLQALAFRTGKIDGKAVWEVAEGDLLPAFRKVRPGYGWVADCLFLRP